ncbi:hypothetical protein BDV96DRAFT_603303 [Lophiotrema nucula]|uniref:Ca2+ regulator and membrane fusion protein Fig1-domain-containing protein n=1 Tax=Lophiotrema nucula TaxID=690887 RepID=A0A6A5YVE3_9PLEO|nr:hypothetical protein BDV96DRAFT_603303 [Lophiotrema nucula]
MTKKPAALSLTGCVSNSPGVSNIFLLKLHDINGEKVFSEIRIGYFRICILWSGERICQATAGRSVDDVLQSAITTNPDLTVVWNNSNALLSTALTLQSKVLISVIAGAEAMFVIGLIFVVLLKRICRAVPTNNAAQNQKRLFLRSVALMAIWSPVAFALAAALSVNQATSALAYITRVQDAPELQVAAGETLVVLQYLAFAITALFAIGISGIFTREGGQIRSSGSTKSYPGSNIGVGQMPGPPPPPPPPPR